ncbi:MAG: hypothetical protein ACREF9_04490, partial [Opitutaceae bacterium]
PALGSLLCSNRNDAVDRESPLRMLNSKVIGVGSPLLSRRSLAKADADDFARKRASYIEPNCMAAG